jgi:pimeloyl-ACP methyl ester carboxylesterase
MNESWRKLAGVIIMWPVRPCAAYTQTRDFGRSSCRYTAHESYSMREVVADMVELLHHVGRQRAVWVGHDWGSPVVWSLASHHPNHTVAVASASYFGINHFSTIRVNYRNDFDCKQTLGTWCWTTAADTTSTSNCCSASKLLAVQRTPLPIALRAPLQSLALALPVCVPMCTLSEIHSGLNARRLARGL